MTRDITYPQLVIGLVVAALILAGRLCGVIV
jgi:hypothetical protein